MRRYAFLIMIPPLVVTALVLEVLVLLALLRRPRVDGAAAALGRVHLLRPACVRRARASACGRARRRQCAAAAQAAAAAGELRGRHARCTR